MIHNVVPPEEVLASPEIKTWIKYLDAFNKKHTNQETTIFDGLSALLTILDAAKKDESTKTLATE